MVVALSTLVAGLKAATLTWFGIKSIKLGFKLGKTLKKEHESLPKFSSGKVKKFYKHKSVSRQARPRFTRSQGNISERIEEIIEECLNNAVISSFHNSKNKQKNVREVDDDDDEIINFMVKSNFSGCSSDCDRCIASPNDAHASPNDALASQNDAHASQNDVHASKNDAHAGHNDVDASLSSSTSLFAAITKECDRSLSSNTSLFARLADITRECEASLASSSAAVSKERQTLREDWSPILEAGEDSSSTVDLNSTMEETLDCGPMLEQDDSLAKDNHVELFEEVFDESRLVIDLEVNDKDTCDGSTDNGREEVIEDDEVVTISDGNLGVAHEVVNALCTKDDSVAEGSQSKLPEEVFDECDDNGREEVMTDLDEEENEVVLVCIKGNTTFLYHTLPIINIKKEHIEDDEEYEVVTISDDESE